MATEPESTSLATGTGARLRALRGAVFEGVLILATLVGIVSLVVLFGYLAFDAVKPMSASLEWYLLFFGTLVAPTAGFTLYTRRHRAVRDASAKSFAVVTGSLTLSVAGFAVLQAVSPQDVLIFAVGGTVPPLAVQLYGRYRDSLYIGPGTAAAAVFGILGSFGVDWLVGLLIKIVFWVLETVLGPVPVLGSLPIPVGLETLVYATAVGLPTVALTGYFARAGRYRDAAVAAPITAALTWVGTTGVYELTSPFVSVLTDWVVYVMIVVVPIAAVTAFLTARRSSTRRGALAGALVLGANIAIVGGGLATGIDPAFWIVFLSGFVVPTVYVLGTTVVDNPEGRVGTLGPFVVAGGVALGALIERQVGIQGLDPWLTPTLFVNSWDGLTATNAGAYPSIVGSVLLIGFMGFMMFPIGVGAAIYLEEYAPETGLWGRLASLLEVNVSNLAGVPSVVYGLLGLALFRVALDFAPGLVIIASVTLGLLVLPIVIVSTQEALRSVPDSLRKASYGMGASRWQTLKNVVLPEAVPGILTGTILALGRAIGETAPLILIGVATTSFSAPTGLMSGATALPLRLFAASANAKPEFRFGVVAAIAVVLLVLMLTMNGAAILIRNRYQNN